jgi:hypothetical protein
LLGAAVLGLGLTSDDGSVRLAEITWRPIYAGSILLTLGLNALLFGGVASLYTTSRSITPTTGLVTRAASACLRFERALLVAGLLLALGLGLDAYLALAGVPETGAPNRATLAGLAQALILTAGSFGIAGLLGSLVRGNARPVANS